MHCRIRVLALAIGTAIILSGTASGAPGLPQSAANAASATEPLYLLTCDHGGLVLWGQDHFAERLGNAVSWLDKYPSFKIGLDNEAHMYDVLAQQNPRLLDHLRELLKRYAGRFGIGTCTYGQPLSAFINEESNVRQLVYAIRANRRHFGCTPVIYLMSEHAMHSQLPQLLTGSGFQGAIMRTHFMMYGYNPTFDAPIGWWVGLDGSRISAVPTYHGQGASFGKTTVDNWILTRWPSKDTPKSLADFRREFAHIHPLLATRADDSGLRREELVQECEGKPEYRWILLDELLETFPRPTVEFKTEPNDFVVRMPWGYCGNEIWDMSRQAEVQVLTAERLAALELMLCGPNREPDLEDAWKNLLVAQHHDIQICGLLAEARRFLPASLAASARVRDGAMQFFASQMKGEGLVQVTAFNPVSWRRAEWLETELSFSQKGEAKFIQVKRGDQLVPSTLLSAERYSDGSLMTARLGFVADLDALSLAAFSIIPGKTDLAGDAAASAASNRVVVATSPLTVLTPFYEAHLHSDGGLASLVDRRTGKPLLKSGMRSGFFVGTIDGADRESKGQWLLKPAVEAPPSVTAREDGFIGTIPYTFELTFHADTPRLDGRVKFHFAGQKLGRVSTNQRDGTSGFIHEQKLRFKLFPATGEQVIGVRDLPFAIAETTNRYVEGIYWTAVSDGQTGLALFNRGTMGSVLETDGGFSVPLAYAMYYIWGTRMLEGDFSYDFALYPFTGDWRKQDLHRRAIEYNFPVVSVSTPPGKGTIGAYLRAFDIGSDNVILCALYPEGGRVLARFYEYQGRPGEMRFAPMNTAAKLESVDLLGGSARTVASPLKFNSWQIQTVAVSW
ncbi:MAG: hypothetical protein QHJ82_01760 [Verrucomicrobiota bacterium]|nr:hypothetical protein [Verrucomicrobiota bacterium]